jgi:serine/threonine-protein kinase
MSAPQLDGYTLSAPVSSQGRSVSYRAKRRADGRWVTVKLPSGNTTDSDAVRRQLRRERDLLSQIKHPGLPTLLEFIDERPALLTEDAGGFRLSQLLKQDPIEAGGALAIAIGLCSILSALHHHDVIHGSLSASSVELTENGGVYLHDCTAPEPAEDLRSPEDMAPEQLLDGALDRTTDVFLVGSLLYRMLTGEAPFANGRDTARHVNARALRRRIQLSGRFGDRRFALRLEKILTRCLRERSRDRYANTAALETALATVLHGYDMTPRQQLVRLAVARAGLGNSHGVNLVSPRRSTISSHAARLRLFVALGAGSLLLAAGIVARCSSTEISDPFRGDAQGIVKGPAKLQFLAQPWAEVHLDGRLLDVTPIGQAVQVAPGKHLVEFKHPQAATQTLHIEVIPEQLLVIDIEMAIVRPNPATPSATASQTKPPSER